MDDISNNLTEPLKKGINLFIDRLDMKEKDRKLFFEILRFTYNEGIIHGMEKVLNEETNS